MNDPHHPLLSVRGDARRAVAPDCAVLTAAITLSRTSMQEATQAVAASLDRLTADLAGQGGAALDVDTERHPLTWSAQSASTHVDRDHNKKTGRYVPTGTVTAAVTILITVRAFDLLDVLGAVLASHSALHVHNVDWRVDWDNPAWPDVRAAAIRAAVRKGHDYAAALGGKLHQVEHIADAGLLGSGDDVHYGSASLRMGPAGGMGGEESHAPSLDPVPQEIVATIEARFSATGLSLAQQ